MLESGSTKKKLPKVSLDFEEQNDDAVEVTSTDVTPQNKANTEKSPITKKNDKLVLSPTLTPPKQLAIGDHVRLRGPVFATCLAQGEVCGLSGTQSGRFHGMAFDCNWVKVAVKTVVDPSFELLYHHPNDQEKILGDVVGAFTLWRPKLLIKSHARKLNCSP